MLRQREGIEPGKGQPDHPVGLVPAFRRGGKAIEVSPRSQLFKAPANCVLGERRDLLELPAGELHRRGFLGFEAPARS